MTSRNRTAGWGWFLAWVAVGACAATGVAAILSIGPVLLVAAAVGAVLLLRKGPRDAAAGSLTGLALLLFYLAYLNRGGPGSVCHAVSGGSTCTDEYTPVPFLAGGVLLAAAGFVIHHLTHRGERRNHSPR
ncbi:hypothetical protein [Streptomyces acidiscabies]|uniref:hypothetical protein n=1 Tax=Streptomyces acidiscabies TaxID=42234 RepID=UPI0038F80430